MQLGIEGHRRWLPRIGACGTGESQRQEVCSEGGVEVKVSETEESCAGLRSQTTAEQPQGSRRDYRGSPPRDPSMTASLLAQMSTYRALPSLDRTTVGFP